MTRTTAKTAALIAAIALVLVLGTRLGSRADGVETGETTEAKIERAMSAGPPGIARYLHARGCHSAQRFRSI
jgi:hypothetical protein